MQQEKQKRVDLEAGEEFGELREQRQQNEADEVGLRRGFGHFVSVHEGRHREPLQLLCVALEQSTAERLV